MLTRINDPIERRRALTLPEATLMNKLKEDTKVTKKAVDEYLEGEEGVDRIHLDPEMVDVLPNVVERITRDILAARTFYRGKEFATEQINVWREHLLEEVKSYYLIHSARNVN
jgi:hypothetical protein